jgi:hypothetical protein
LDILISDYNGSKIYLNNGNNTFTLHNGTKMAASDYGAGLLADYNNNGNLDILVTNIAGSISASKLYRNDIAVQNIAPGSPTGLSSSVNGNSVKLKWQSVTGDATPYKGMSYNVRIGASSGALDIVSPLSLSNGTRLIPAMGNCQLDTFFILTKLKKGTYYWSVQAVDNGFIGGNFATEGSFTITSTDIDKSETPGIKLYPNPAYNQAILENIPGKAEISIYSIDGRIIKEPWPCENNTTLNLGGLKSGIYLVKITTKAENIKLKLFKQ